MDPLHKGIRTLANFVRAVLIKRALNDVDPDPSLNFWRVIYGNLMDMAVIDWTKLFGSHTDQPTHWKNVVPESQRDDFRKDLLKAMGLSEDEWKKYWEEIKAYRDECAAHQAEIPTSKNFPRFDVALKAGYFYYGWILTQMQDQGQQHRYPLDLEEYCERFAAQARKAAQLATAGTASMEEVVY